MHPDRRCRRRERLHALRQKPEHDPGENIAAAGRRQLGRRVRVDRDAAVGGGDDGVGALQHDHRAALPAPRRRARSGLLPAGSNRRANSPSCGVITQGERIAENSVAGLLGERGQRIGVEHGALLRLEDRQRFVAGLLTRPRRPGPISTALRRLSARSARKSSRPADRMDDDPGQRRGIDRECGLGCRERDEPGADPRSALRRQPRGTGHHPRRRRPARARACIYGFRGPAEGNPSSHHAGSLAAVSGTTRSSTASGMPICTSTISPQWPRPGSSRWPGFLRKKVTVSRRLRCDPAHLAARPVDPARDIDRDHRQPALVERLDDRPRGPLDRARQPGAEDAVDDEGRTVERRRAPAARPAPGQRAAASAASPRNAARPAEQRHAAPASRARPARRAATKPSPPLFPGPHRTTTGRGDQRRETASATPRPAFSISAHAGNAAGDRQPVGLAHLLRRQQRVAAPARLGNRHRRDVGRALRVRKPKRGVPSITGGRHVAGGSAGRMSVWMKSSPLKSKLWSVAMASA